MPKDSYNSANTWRDKLVHSVQQSHGNDQEKFRNKRQFDPNDTDLAKLFTAIREHKTGNPVKNKIEKIENLLPRIADIDGIDLNDNGNTVLHVAALKGHLDVIELLLKNGANPDTKNKAGETPLDLLNLAYNHSVPNRQAIIQLLQNPPSANKRPHTNPDLPAKRIKSGPTVSDPSRREETYPASGLKNSLHGVYYQLRLLMLFFKRGLDKGYDFSLATEWDAAEKFDDLVFRYKDSQGDTQYRFLQAKHKLDEDEKITVGKLLTEDKNGEFNLEKYFVSYLKIKKNTGFRLGILQDFIICTNIDFDIDPSISSPTKLQPMRGGANKGKEIIIEKINTDDDFFKYGGIRYKIKENYDLTEHLKKGLEVQKVAIDQNIQDTDLAKEIKAFFEKLVFAVHQPNEIALDRIISDEIGEKFNLLDADLLSDNFLKEMLDWMKSKGAKGAEGRFLSTADGKEFFRFAEEKLSKIEIMGPTSGYSVKLSQLGVVFEDRQLSEVRGFLEDSSLRVLNLIAQQETRLSAIKVNQVLQKRSLHKDSYIFMPLARMLRLQGEIVNAFGAAATGNLLVIECKNAENTNPKFDEDLKSIVKKHPSKKIILITKKNHPLANEFTQDSELGNTFKTLTDTIHNLLDLTPVSQTTMLEKTVVFQGIAVALGDLIGEKKSIIDVETLSRLVDNDERIEIANPVPQLSDIDRECYIERTFHNKKISRITAGEITDKTVIIAAGPGMGKSLVLTHIVEQEKRNNPSVWIVQLNLIEHKNALDIENFENYNQERAIAFLVKLMNLHTVLEQALFKDSFNQLDRIALFFDGFDEISPLYKDKVITLLVTLKDTQVKKLWVTTREHMRDKLEEGLGIAAYALNPLSADDQTEFLKKFFRNSLKIADVDEARLHLCTKKLLDVFAYRIDIDKKFTGVPLQLKMIAEVFQGNFKKFYDARDQNEFSLPEDFNLAELYKKFIEIKFDLYSNARERDIRPSKRLTFATFFKQRQLLALYALFGPDNVELFGHSKMHEINSLIADMEQGDCYVGIIDRIIHSDPQFVHLTFAEYFAATALADMAMKNPSHIDEEKRKFLREQIFDPENERLHYFFDSVVSQHSALHKAILNSNYKEASRLLDEGKNVNCKDSIARTPLGLAAAYDEYEIVELLLWHTADITGRDNVFEWSPLSFADASISDVYDRTSTSDIMELLLQSGADPKDMHSINHILDDPKNYEPDYEPERDDVGELLERAITKKHEHLVKHLIERAESTLRRHSKGEFTGFMNGEWFVDEHGNTLLHYAAQSASIEIVRWLMHKGFKSNTANDSRETPIDWAKAALLAKVEDERVTRIYQQIIVEIFKVLNPQEFRKQLDKLYSDMVELYAENSAVTNLDTVKLDTLQRETYQQLIAEIFKIINPPHVREELEQLYEKVTNLKVTNPIEDAERQAYQQIIVDIFKILEPQQVHEQLKQLYLCIAELHEKGEFELQEQVHQHIIVKVLRALKREQMQVQLSQFNDLLSNEVRDSQQQFYRQIIEELQATIRHCFGSNKRKKRNINGCLAQDDESYRDVREGLAILKDAHAWKHALEASGHLQADWIPILETAKEIVGGKEQMHFLHRNTQETRVIEFPQQLSLPFQKKLQGVYRKMRETLSFSQGAPEIFDKDSESAETVDGLNAAFTIQLLFTFFQQKSREEFQTDRGPLSLALEIHNYLNLAQAAQGTVLDVSKIIHLVKSLLRQEVFLAEKPLSLFTQGFKQFATEGLGVLLGVGNVVLDSIELSNANTEAEKALFGTQLAFDTGGLSLALGSMGAAFVGASGTVAVLGGGTVILGGLGIGVTSLVKVFSDVVANAEAVGAYFFALDRAYQNGGYKKISVDNQTFMNPLFGAVITEIDFHNDSMTYGSPRLYRTHHGHTGNGKINYFFWGGDFPKRIMHKNQALDIRDRLGYPQQNQLDSWKDCPIWILPVTPTVYISYAWTNLPFATTRGDKGFSVLRKLEERYDFDYDFYIFPSEYTITRLYEERVTTTITIRLDERQRTLFIPKLSEKDHTLYTHLHYVLEASHFPGGQCFLGLNKVASIRLIERQADYTWIISAKNLSDDKLTFTATGVAVGGIPIDIPQQQAQYRFVDRVGGTFTLNFTQRLALLTSLDFTFLQKHHFLQGYVQSHAVPNPANPVIIINNFPLYDDHEVDYTGKVYYSPKEECYFYTNAIPKEFSDAADLIFFTKKVAYFFNPSLSLFWRTGNANHQLEKNYVFFDRFTPRYAEQINSSLIAHEIQSVSVEDGFMTIVQAFILAYPTSTPSIQRQAIYHLVDDQPILQALVDDKLLRMLHNNKNSSSMRSNVFLQSLCQQDIFNASVGNVEKSLRPKKPSWDSYPKLSGEPAVAKTGHVVNILSFTKNSKLTPLWVKQQGQYYQLIDPGIPQRKLSFLGSLFTASQQEVFYFFLVGGKKSSAQLFRQPEGAKVATRMNLAIINVFWSDNLLLILTPEHVLKKVDALGKVYTLSFSSVWTNANPDWWKRISRYLEKSPPGERLLAVFGIVDQRGRALGVWYDSQTQEFILVQPPSKSNGQQFHMTYLGKVAGSFFFFCEDGTLYQQKSRSTSRSMRALFKGTQLRSAIPSLEPLAVALAEASLRKQTLWIRSQTGLVFSFSPQQLNLWFLEKIAYPQILQTSCMKQIMATPHFNFTESERFKYCFISLFQSGDFHFDTFCIPIALSKKAACFTAHNHSLIPIEGTPATTTLWWHVENDLFFHVPKNKDGSGWIHLGMTRSNLSACFFSPHEKIMYSIPGDTVIHPQKSYHRLPAELAVRSNKESMLLLLPLPLMEPVRLPLLDGIKTLGLQFSGEAPFVFPISAELMNHYQTIVYQYPATSNIQGNELEFTSGDGEFFAYRNQHDIIIFHTYYRCQFVLANAMTDDEPHDFLQNTFIRVVDVQPNATQMERVSVLEIRNQLKETTTFEANQQQRESIRLSQSNAINNITFFGRHLLSANDANASQKTRMIPKLDVQGALELITVSILRLAERKLPRFRPDHTISLFEAHAYAAIIAEKVERVVEFVAYEHKVILENGREQTVWPLEPLQRELRRALMQKAPLEKVMIAYIDSVYLTQIDEQKKIVMLSAIQESLELDLRRIERKGLKVG